MSVLQDRLRRGEVIILDGAIGTELQHRKVPMSDVAWCATSLVSHPDVVREVHEDYIRAGAEVITTNTYATARHVLEPVSLGDEVGALNEKAVRLAQEARDRAAADHPVYIAGSMSTFGARNDRARLPNPRQERANYLEQAEILAEAGVDLLLPENLYSIEQGGYAVEAAIATGLPTWIGFSARPNADGSKMLMTNREEDQDFEEGVKAILALGGDAATVMHTNVPDMGPALSAVLRNWKGTVGAYAHSGRFKMPNWEFVDLISPADYAVEAGTWIDLGARIVGGCCGIGPEHIRVLAESLASGKKA